MQCCHSFDVSGREESDSEETDRHAKGKKLRQPARLRVMVDHLLNGISGSITPLEWRVLRTQAAAHQYRDVIPRFKTFCSESSLLLKTPAQLDSALVTYSRQN